MILKRFTGSFWPNRQILTTFTLVLPFPDLTLEQLERARDWIHHANKPLLWTELGQSTRIQVRTRVVATLCIHSKPLRSDHSTVATYTPQTDGRSTNLSSTNTPQSDYGIAPTSVRPSGFPDPRYGQHPHAPAHHYHPGAVATMAQPNSPSPSLLDGNEHDHHKPDESRVESNGDVPIDPSISQASPTYPPGPYPYPPPGHQISPYGDQGHPQMYAPRPDWPYGQHPGMASPYGHPPPSQQPPPGPPQRPGQVRTH